MEFWNELDVSDWRKYERKGDKYLPFRPYIRKFVEMGFEYPDTDIERGIVICAGGRFLPGTYVTVPSSFMAVVP